MSMMLNDCSAYAQERPTLRGSANRRPMMLARNLTSEFFILPMKRMHTPTLKVRMVMSTTIVLNATSESLAAATMCARNNAA